MLLWSEVMKELKTMTKIANYRSGLIISENNGWHDVGESKDSRIHKTGVGRRWILLVWLQNREVYTHIKACASK